MKVLILGDGLLGSELHKQTGWDVASRKLGNLDINNPEDLNKLIKKYNTVINCVAHTQSYSSDQFIHKEVNYKFAVSISNLCNNNKNVYLSISWWPFN